MSLARTILAQTITCGLLLAACGQICKTADNGQQPIMSVESPISPTASPSPIPLSSTPLAISCDPSMAEYCIVGGTFYLQRPISPPGNDSVDRTYPYASTYGGTRDPHHGVEFPNATGTSVLAAADGTVFFAGDDSSSRLSPWNNFYGNLVVLKHPLAEQTLYTLYAHLSMVNVVRGQSIQAGDTIGEVGATGSTFGSHLHFEVRQDPLEYDSTLNPELWLVPLSETGVISVRLVDEAGDFCSVPLSIQYFPNSESSIGKAWELDVYPADMVQTSLWENAVMGEMIPGRYRVTFLWDGTWQERWVNLGAGKITLVEFILAQ